MIGPTILLLREELYLTLQKKKMKARMQHFRRHYLQLSCDLVFDLILKKRYRCIISKN